MYGKYIYLLDVFWQHYRRRIKKQTNKYKEKKKQNKKNNHTKTMTSKFEAYNKQPEWN